MVERLHPAEIDSDHCDRGTGEVLITPRDDGGSRVDVPIHDSRGRGLRGRTVLPTQRVLSPLAIPRAWRSALDRLAN